MNISHPVLIGLFFLSSFALCGQTDLENHSKIAKTLSFYLNGGTNNAFETLSKAFHPTATMKFIDGEGNYKEVNALEFFKKGMKPGPKSDRKTRIVAINTSGTAASAQLEIEYDTFFFIDYMHLFLVEGEWKIVSKIFYKKEKS